jgi:hypothetical protein
MSAIGIPVYLHYCGGALEKVNYVIKSNSCCGGEEDDSKASANDCCKDENVIIQNTPDFTIRQFHHYDLVKTFCDLFYVSLSFSTHTYIPACIQNKTLPEASPPGLQQRVLISTSILRI